jgi:methionyl-tRNA synthetase
VERVHALGNLGNKYYQDRKPWELVRTDPAAAGAVMVTCVNLVKALSVFLKPVIPGIVASIEKQFGGGSWQWDDHRFSLRNVRIGATEKLVIPIEPADFSALVPSLGRDAGEGRTPVIPAKTASGSEPIDITAFQAVAMRVGTVVSADRIEGSDKLLKLIVDGGDARRQIVAGIGKHYDPAALPGRQVVFVANLKPATLMGLASEGMVLAAQKGRKLVLLAPSDAIPPGAKVS